MAAEIVVDVAAVDREGAVAVVFVPRLDGVIDADDLELLVERDVEPVGHQDDPRSVELAGEVKILPLLDRELDVGIPVPTTGRDRIDLAGRLTDLLTDIGRRVHRGDVGERINTLRRARAGWQHRVCGRRCRAGQERAAGHTTWCTGDEMPGCHEYSPWKCPLRTGNGKGPMYVR